MSQIREFPSLVPPIPPINTITGDVGGAVAPTLGNINLLGLDPILVTGNPGFSTLVVSIADATVVQRGSIQLATNAETIAGTDFDKAVTPDDLTAKLGLQTDHAVILGQGITNALGVTNVATDAQILIGHTGADPIFGNLTSTGGTVVITLVGNDINLEAMGVGDIAQITTDDANVVVPLAGNVNLFGAHGLNTTGAIANTATVAINNTITLGDLVDVTGSDALTVTTGSISISSGNLNLPATDATGNVGIINVGGSPFIHSYGTRNTFVGLTTGNLTLTVASAVDNTGCGFFCLPSLTTGEQNCALGTFALNEALDASGNTSIGYGSMAALESGTGNTCIGISAGGSYLTSESENILINHLGVVGDNAVIRIGAFLPGGGSCYISGISSINVGSVADVVSIDQTTGQLGTTTITAGTGLTVTPGANTITIAANASLTLATGFATWGGAGNYFDDTTLGSFTILRPGTGYINGVLVSWLGSQTVAGMTAGNTYYIYIDNTGTIGKTPTRTNALYQDNIVLFECLRDSTPVTNNQITVKENHPYQFEVAVSNYNHDVIGTVIENTNNGANITINGTQKIQINGADELEDHGLSTTIPDSGGVAVVWRKMYTDAGGKWAEQNENDTFAGFYNNAGTPTALTAGRFAIYTLYVSKDTLTSTAPTYYAVLDIAQYTSLAAANTAISNGTPAKATNELLQLEFAQLGYIVFRQSTNAIVNVVISKSTLKQTLSTGGTNTAALVNVVTTNFDHILSASDTNVQAALETIDDYQKWNEITAASAGMVINQNYIANRGTLVTLTLPATSPVGVVIEVTGKGAGGWKIAQNAGNTIFFGNATSTPGAGGFIASTLVRDSVRLVCVTADSDWNVLSSVGNITVS